MKNFAILIPIYNEAKKIGQVIKNINKTNYPYWIVNDGSTDDSKEIIENHLTNQGNYTEYNQNKGKGYAIRYGARYILKDYDWVITMDGDGQNLITDIANFETAIRKYNNSKIIIGNRLHNSRKMPFIRLITNKIMSWYISNLANTNISDSQCGFRAIHRDIFKLRLYCDRFEFESEMLIKAGKNNLEIKSIPVACIYNKNNIKSSKINPIIDTFRFFRMIKKIRCNNDTKKN